LTFQVTIGQISNAQTDIQGRSPSPDNSLFSEGSSPEVKIHLAKTSSKPQPKIKLIDIEPRNVASGSTLSTKQRIMQNASGSLKVMPAPPSRKFSLSNMAFKKNPAPTSGSGDRAEPEARPAQYTLLSDLNEVSRSPTSYQRDLPSPDARLDYLYLKYMQLPTCPS
jgi:hypothetical protein